MFDVCHQRLIKFEKSDHLVGTPILAARAEKNGGLSGGRHCDEL